MNELQIDKEFQQLIPPLSAEEYTQLESNLMKEGCRDALITWNGTLVDGHNRYAICRKHRIKFETIEKEFSNRQEAIEWIILNQFGRRNLTSYQRSELALKLKPIIQGKAKSNQIMGGGAVRQKSAQPVKSRDELAKLAGISHDTLLKAEMIQNQGTPEQIERARQGGRGNAISTIANEIQSAKTETKICNKCKKEKPLSEFYVNKGRCKTCCNSQRPTKDLKGNAYKVDEETQKFFREHGDQIIDDLYDCERIVEYTADDMVDELKSILSYFCRNTKRCLTDHKNLLETKKNEQKIIAVLSEAETAIKELRSCLHE